MALYDGFISYSHAKDKPIAAALQSAVQRLGKPWYLLALRLFRDDTSISATPGARGRRSNGRSVSRAFFVLLASLEAAASHWVKARK